jgi:hypothetical protein
MTGPQHRSRRLHGIAGAGDGEHVARVERHVPRRQQDVLARPRDRKDHGTRPTPEVDGRPRPAGRVIRGVDPDGDGFA